MYTKFASRAFNTVWMHVPGWELQEKCKSKKLINKQGESQIQFCSFLSAWQLPKWHPY